MNFYYVYILENVAEANRFYVSFTEDLAARLKRHNNGEVSHTSKFRLWKIKTAIAFIEHQKALEFERYLKSGSGRAFAKRHL